MKIPSILSRIPAAAALFAFRANGSPVAQPVFTDAGFAIAIQCWSFKEFTLFEAIEMAAAAGAGAVEVYPGQPLGGGFDEVKFGPGMAENALQAVIGHLAENHLAAINLGVIEIPHDEAEARKIFEFARKLGLYGITTESLGAIDILEKLAAEFDLKVCFHNHPRPTALWNPDTVWDALQGRHPNLGFCADVGHWAASGLDPLAVIRKIAPRVHAFHLKDRASIQEPGRDLPFGSGILDLPALLDEARRHGFAGNVTIEYEFNWQANLPEIAQCVGYLRAYSQLRETLPSKLTTGCAGPA
ncbi:sugar phosphate isomerase/epimerase [bacterium]|nr:sugar phosphate isomerase/epimerase [bacterium]